MENVNAALKGFSIQKDNQNKNTVCIFRSAYYKCRKKFNVRINSIFELFLYNWLLLLAEIFSCFISKEYNVAQTLKYITTEKHYVVSSNVVSKIF